MCVREGEIEEERAGKDLCGVMSGAAFLLWRVGSYLALVDTEYPMSYPQKVF